MSLMLCPECRNEVSTAAAACPNCGFPLQAQPAVFVEEQTFVRQPDVIMPAPVERSSFPNWVFVPVALALVLVLFGFLWLAQTRDDNRNRAQTDAQTTTAETRRVTTTETVQTDLPSTAVSNSSVSSVPSAGVATLPPPSTVSSSTSTATTTTNVPSTVAGGETISTAPTAPTSGVVNVKATIVSQQGVEKPVRKETFYLLDEDLETILRRANVASVSGDLPTSMGVALVDPSKKAILQQYLAAIKPHIVYKITTDNTGKALFKDVKPDDYYLFGITRDGDSFAIWNQNVVVNAGENSLAINGSATPVTLDSVSEY